MIEFKFADIGEGIHEGKLLKWMVEVGKEVKDGDSLFLVETDKVNAEIPSPDNGKIVELLAQEGDIIHVGDVVVKIDDGSEQDESKDESKKDAVSEDEEESAGVVGELMVSGQVIEESKEIPQNQGKENNVKKVLATPVARKVAKDLGIDINSVKGTGPVGRVMKEDIYRMNEELEGKEKSKDTDVPEETTEVKKVKSGGLEERIKLTMLRKTIAKNMTLSKSVIPHAAVMEEIDVTDLVKFRKDTKETSSEQGIKLTFMPFIMKALILTLKEYPEFNSSYDEEKEEIVLKKYYNIGIATDTPGGLMVPVVKDVDKKGIFEIARDAARLTEGARNKTLTLEDLKNGTFSITNYGSLGAGSGIPIIKHPEVAILGVGKIVKKPVVIEGEITIRDIMPTTLCIDHRVIDGGDGARFIKKFKEYLSDPMLLVLS